MSTASFVLPFERPIVELDEQLERLARSGDAERLSDEIAKLRGTRDRMLEKVFAELKPWDIVRVARHPDRPQSTDYIARIARDFRELHGDRHFGDDPAIVAGLGRIGPHKCLIVGHRKGRTTAEKIRCHFGCAHPEGYRKALAKMKFAEKFGLPIVTFIDTPGAYPGLKAEERGQAEAIAMNLREMSRLRVPVVSVVIGEGGSGGALGIGVGDRTAMLEYAWYSVISPEGCAAILWKEANERTNTLAAESLALTATANLKNGLIDHVIREPPSEAHRDPAVAADAVERWVVDTVADLQRFNPQNLVRLRYERLRRIGELATQPSPATDA